MIAQPRNVERKTPNLRPYLRSGQKTDPLTKEDPRDKRPTEIEEIEDEDKEGETQYPPIGDKPKPSPQPQAQNKNTIISR